MAHEPKRKPRPLDGEALERLALFYAGRYATTCAKLKAYLARKLAQRGWAGDGEAPVERLAERLAELGYVDDKAFAAGRAASLGRRGFGERRVRAALAAAGIGEEDAAEAREQARNGAWAAAVEFARRRRIGPFAAAAAERAEREKALAAMLRAGHPARLARRIIWSAPGEIPDADSF